MLPRELITGQLLTEIQECHDIVFHSKMIVLLMKDLKPKNQTMCMSKYDGTLNPNHPVVSFLNAKDEIQVLLRSEV